MTRTRYCSPVSFGGDPLAVPRIGAKHSQAQLKRDLQGLFL